MVANTRVTPSSIRKADRVVPGWACRGLAVWEKPSVVCRETISPAVVMAVMKLRRMAPMARPVSTSRITQPTVAPKVAGRAGRLLPTMGHSASDSTRASDRRTLGGT
ncbi:hypothetical protein D3C73_1262880 [compost metagenome]